MVTTTVHTVKGGTLDPKVPLTVQERSKMSGELEDELRRVIEDLRDVERDEYREPAYRERMAMANRLEGILNER